MDDLYALILAGGRGTRFWPVSRSATPKQCITLGDDRPLLAQTIERLEPLIPRDRIFISTGRAMEEAVRRVAVGIPTKNVLVEPWGRNTAPCIGWGAVEIGRRDPNGVVVVCPSDHVIGDEEGLREAIYAAAGAAQSTNNIVTLGIEPNRPETGFGYLRVGPVVGEWGGCNVHAVDQFIEKPDPDTAQRYLDVGGHLWNAGMFVFTVGALRDAYRSHLPRTAEALERVGNDPIRLDEEWGNMDAISIDYGIMERCRHVLTVPLDVGWSDVGSWAAAGAVMKPLPGGRGIANAVYQKDSSGNVVFAPGKAVAMIGVEGLVVVDTPDALLVMTAERSQQVGEIVRAIEEDDCEDLL